MTACLDQGPDTYLDGSPCWSGQFPQVEMIYAGDEIWQQRTAKRRQTLHGALDPGNANRSNLPAERIDKMHSMLKEYTSAE
jgi:hypothetical protein